MTTPLETSMIMDEGVAVTSEYVMAMLGEEKAQLEKRLETETAPPAEIEQIKERLEEIYGYFKQPVTQVSGPPAATEVDTVRRSEREKRPTEKMKVLKELDIEKRERRFWSIYTTFKTEVQFVRSKLKDECSKSALEWYILSVQRCESNLKRGYESIRAVKTPSQDVRRKMDTCTAVADQVVSLLKKRCAEAESIVFDPEAARAETL